MWKFTNVSSALFCKLSDMCVIHGLTLHSFILSAYVTLEKHAHSPSKIEQKNILLNLHMRPPLVGDHLFKNRNIFLVKSLH